jgi:putative transposase
MKYRLIEAEKAEHRICRLCTVLGVTRQGFGFYAWRRRGPSLRQLGDAELARLIVTIYDGSFQTYGAPRIQLELADEHDVHVGRKRVARLMRDLGIEGVSRRGEEAADDGARSEGAAGTRPGRAPRRRRGRTGSGSPT